MKSFLLLLLAVVTTIASAQSLRIKLRNGSTASIPISQIRKISFEGLTGIDGKSILPTIPSAFLLLQNYPNPFNPTTTIEYHLATPGAVQVRIFDLSGRLVRTILSNYAEGGIKHVTWEGKDNNGTTVASGAYVYQAIHNGSVLAKKMLFIK